MASTLSVLGSQHETDSVEKKPASLPVVVLGKALSRVGLSLCGKEMMESTVVVAQSGNRLATRA